MSIFKKITAISILTTVFFAPASFADNDYPTKRMNYTIAFGPGGGNDLMSRTVVDILKKYDIYEPTIRVDNLAGGSGAVGFNFVAKKKGSEYNMTSTSGNFLGTPLISNTGWTYRDFTPIGLLAQDAMFIVVRADSKFKTAKDFVEHAKNNRVTIGGTGAAGPERVTASLFSQVAGFNFDYVPSQSGGGMVTSLTSNSVDAIVANPSEVSGQIAAGKFRALAYSEAQRSTVYKDVPTFKEQGYDFAFSLPRGIVMPAGISKEVQQWWIAALKKVIATKEWKSYLKTNSLSGNTMWGEEFSANLAHTSADFERVLKEIGAVK
ncbi:MULTISPECIES: Bug family tripartite tricarboxylate transporter substrate binding protein [unclassified Pseudoalteromonas]|uniref:Bug family tripartite tricarboxylate transporter substrate binding protein n=1 Tax=unclassified Pseudoalteromonas TaxID=194690 RepID=UPI0025745231|nr:tripartite tricarboxylate transporter substrate binding protein [Pseudoalteromonas sp. MM1]BED91372.1 tricarboxylate transporter [Pseudoalteromonas sp. MM1]